MRAVVDASTGTSTSKRSHATTNAARARAQRDRPRELRLSGPLAFDPYARNRETGSFILVDEATNDTVGAGLIATPEG